MKMINSSNEIPLTHNFSVILKKTIFILLTITTFTNCNAQINLEKTFDEGELIVGSNAYYDTGANSEFIITFNMEKQTLNLYNQDYSLYKTLTNIFDVHYTSITPSYITRGLFNTDNKLEFLAYMIRKDGTISTRILNEDGDVIEDFGSSSSAYCIKVKNKVKLLITRYEVSYDSQNTGVKYTSEIYSVPGNLKQ